jgi:ABC-type Zn2+ transport system substrate-binding protein/surface adhesin
VLDPLGTGIPDGPGLYFTLMRNIAASMRACLTPTG